MCLFVESVEHRAQSRVVLRVFGDEYRLFDRTISWPLVSAFVPRLRNSQPPALLKKRQVRVRAAQQQHSAPERSPSGKNAEILEDDRISERAEDFARRDPAFYQIDYVGFGEHAALRGDMVQFRIVEVEGGYELRGRVHLQKALVDRGPGTGSALVVHRCGGSFFSRLLVPLEHDDLRVLTSELDDGADVRMQVLHRQGDRVDLLNELAPPSARKAAQRRIRSGTCAIRPPDDRGMPRIVAASTARTRAASCGGVGSRSKGAPWSRIDDDGLHRCGSDVHSDRKLRSSARSHVRPSQDTRLACQSVRPSSNGGRGEGYLAAETALNRGYFGRIRRK